MVTNQATQRYFWCDIEKKDKTFLSVRSPISASINIQKTITGNLSTATIRIANLTDTDRKLVEVDRFQTQNPQAISGMGGATQLTNPIYRRVYLYGGYTTNGNYNSQPPLIFRGNILEAYTDKPDRVNTELVINVIDGLYGFSNSYSSVSIETPTTNSEVMKKMINQFKNIETGYINPLCQNSYPRGYSSNAPVVNELKHLSAGDPSIPLTSSDVFIENEKVYILGSNQARINTSMLVFNAQNIIGTPRLTATTLDFTTTFTPRLVLGQQIRIESQYNSFINGTYKVCTIHHNGVLSPTKNAQCLTTIKVWRNLNQVLVPVSV